MNAKDIGLAGGLRYPRPVHAMIKKMSVLPGTYPAAGQQDSVLSPYQRLVKRVVDLVLGSLVLVSTLPLVVTAAALIWLEDGDPIFFRQERVGEAGRLFPMYKLRTMKADPTPRVVRSAGLSSHVEPPQKRRDDPRVTRVGRLLRHFSIDELPQLVNVLKGEMSLVGPRPELPELVANYEPWQRERLGVPAGITGWWQVTGRGDKVMHLHTEDDIFYTRNWSFGLDLGILVRTLWVVLIGRGAF